MVMVCFPIVSCANDAGTLCAILNSSFNTSNFHPVYYSPEKHSMLDEANVVFSYFYSVFFFFFFVKCHFAWDKVGKSVV